MRPVRRGASAAAGAAVARRMTPLHVCAATIGDAAVIKAGLARLGHADVAAALINAGADMTIQNVHGCAIAAVQPVQRGRR